MTDTATVLLTLGRLPVALELARAFRAAGWRVVVAEPVRWTMSRLSRDVAKSVQVTAPNINRRAYLEQLQAIVSDEAVSLVVPVSEEMLFVSLLKEMLPASVPVVCMQHELLLKLCDKWAFNQLLIEIGLSAPETTLAGESDTRHSIVAGSYIVKPRFSCSGQGVFFHNADNPVSAGHSNNAFVLQQRLDGELCCTFAIVANGSCLQLVAYRSLLESGSVSVCFEQMAVPESVVATVYAIAEHTQYCGMLSFDFMRDSTGQWQAIECNPRATSGLHLLERKDIVHALTVAASAVSKSSARASADADRSTFGKASAAPDTRYKKSPRQQEFWSSLGAVEAKLFRGQLKWEEWKRVFFTRDINWSWRDPMPFLLLTVVMWPHLWRAIKDKHPVSEQLMQDVQWRGSGK